jgi:hypothetical protein
MESIFAQLGKFNIEAEGTHLVQDEEKQISCLKFGASSDIMREPFVWNVFV